MNAGESEIGEPPERVFVADSPATCGGRFGGGRGPGSAGWSCFSLLSGRNRRNLTPRPSATEEKKRVISYCCNEFIRTTKPRWQCANNRESFSLFRARTGGGTEGTSNRTRGARAASEGAAGRPGPRLPKPVEAWISVKEKAGGGFFEGHPGGRVGRAGPCPGPRVDLRRPAGLASRRGPKLDRTGRPADRPELSKPHTVVLADRPRRPVSRITPDRPGAEVVRARFPARELSHRPSVKASRSAARRPAGGLVGVRSASPQGLFDLLVGLVLAERVDRPDRRRQPSDQGDLENQADDPARGRPIVKNSSHGRIRAIIKRIGNSLNSFDRVESRQRNNITPLSASEDSCEAAKDWRLRQGSNLRPAA